MHAQRTLGVVQHIDLPTLWTKCLYTINFADFYGKDFADFLNFDFCNKVIKKKLLISTLFIFIANLFDFIQPKSQYLSGKLYNHDEYVICTLGCTEVGAIFWLPLHKTQIIYYRNTFQNMKLKLFFF